MNIEKYVKAIRMSKEGIIAILKDDSEHLIMNNNGNPTISLYDYIKNNFKVSEIKSFEGWLGGDYEKLGFYDTQKDADRGIIGGEYLTDLLNDFKGKKVSIQITEID